MSKKNLAVYMAHPNRGDTHEILNVSMIIMLVNIYRHVIIICPSSCGDNLKVQLSKQNIKEEQISFVYNSIGRKKGLAMWMVCGFQCLCDIWNYHKADFYFSTINFLFVPIFAIMSKLFRIKMKTLCHNDLEHLINPREGFVNIHWYMINYIFRYMPLPKSFQFIVLGDSIRNNLTGIMGYNRIKNIISICHPYYTNIYSLKKELGKEINIGIVGTIKQKDESQLKILNCILNEYSTIKLHFISITSIDMKKYTNIINHNPRNLHLSRKQYDSLITQMDYLYYPYPSTDYQVSASGAVYEAIVKGKPIIAANNSYFKWLFEKFGLLGYLYDDINDLKKHIPNIIDKNKYNIYINNELKAATLINPQKYHHEFKKIIEL